MSEDGNYQFLGPPIQKNKWIEAQQQAVEGWEYLVQDNVTGATVRVFVPASVLGKDQVDTLVRHELAKLRDVHTLGGAGA